MKIGREIEVRSLGHPVRIERLIGEGSQGSVYEAGVVGQGTASIAVKWYFPHTATPAQRDALVALVERGAPSPRFLWPIEVLEAPGESGFGYAMDLRPASFAGLSELLTGKVDVPFSMVCRLCLDLADAFLQLHSQGLCYRDISFGNVFFDPMSGQPLICDNDNVGIDGRAPTTVLGTRRFMAPEIVRREAAPSSTTDLYSLAILLFYVLMAGHPLVGRRESEFECWDESVESVLFGHEPLFVFDPDDDSNAPDPDAHGSLLQYWSLYPAFVRELFVKAFTTGLHDPLNGRVRESVWRAMAARLLDSIQSCPNCEKQNFFERGARRRCWFCEHDLPEPLLLEVDRHHIVASKGAGVFRHHVYNDYDVRTTLGTVVEHPARPGVLGLQNMTSTAWRATPATGSTQAVEPGRSLRITAGTTVELDSGVILRVVDSADQARV